MIIAHTYKHSWCVFIAIFLFPYRLYLHHSYYAAFTLNRVYGDDDDDDDGFYTLLLIFTVILREYFPFCSQTRNNSYTHTLHILFIYATAWMGRNQCQIRCCSMYARTCVFVRCP